MTTINIKIKTKSRHKLNGLIAVAYELVPTKDTSNLRRKVSQSWLTVSRKVGQAVTNSKGECTITLDAKSKKILSKKAKLFVSIYQGEQKIGSSIPKKIDSLLSLIIEVGFAANENETVVKVVNAAGNPVEGAEVFYNGLLKGSTNINGVVTLQNVQAGQQLAARLLLKENHTSRGNHSQLSDQNWNYRVYTNSVPIEHDANGNNVQLPLHTISNPREEQRLQLNPNNTIVAFNIVVSFEWDVPILDLIFYRDRFFEMAELLFNATDGQFTIEHFVFADDKKFWDTADYRVYANNKQHSHATLGGFFGDEGYIYMNPYDTYNSGAILHELGHYAFDIRDEENGANGCTHEGVNGVGTAFSENGEKEACIMRGGAMQFRSLKICSAHPDNPHVTGTPQGDGDCWTVIQNKFNHPPLWKIHTPKSRNAIPGRLPDSGVPIARITKNIPWDKQAASFIPVFGWKPLWHFDDVWNEDECPDLKITVRYYDQIEGDARVTITKPNGRVIVQGYTYQQTGELFILGAYKGDTITIANHRLLIIDTIPFSGPNLSLEFNFKGWQGGGF